MYTTLSDHQWGSRVLIEIIDAMKDLHKQVEAKGLTPRPFSEWVTHLWDIFMEEGDFRAIITHGYLFVYTLSTSPWYDGWFVNEESLIRFSKDADFSAAMQTIENMARAKNATAILMGTSAAPNKAYSRLLRRYGFSEISHQLMKEI